MVRLAALGTTSMRAMVAATADARVTASKIACSEGNNIDSKGSGGGGSDSDGKGEVDGNGSNGGNSGGDRWQLWG